MDDRKVVILGARTLLQRELLAALAAGVQVVTDEPEEFVLTIPVVKDVAIELPQRDRTWNRRGKRPWQR